jgi:Glycosyltransferase 61
MILVQSTTTQDRLSRPRRRHGKGLFLASSACLLLTSVVVQYEQKKLDRLISLTLSESLLAANNQSSSGSDQHSSSNGELILSKDMQENSDNIINSSYPLSTACQEAKSILPAHFTNYSQTSIEPNLNQLFDIDPIPVMREISSDPHRYVTCSILHVGFWMHFPHTFQQVLRCWSLWQAFPDHQPVLVGVMLHDTFNHGIYTTLVKLGIQFREWGNVTKSSNNDIQANDTSISGTSKLAISNPTNGEDALDGYKVLSTQHAEHFRDQFLTALGIEDSRGGCSNEASTTRRSPPRVGILNRKSSRGLDNVSEIIEALAEKYGGFQNLIVFEMEGKTFQEQVQVLSQVDILVAPHGAALTGTIFMPRCAGFVEIFPMGMIGEQKFFGSLAPVSNHAHAALYAGGENMTEEVSFWWSTVRRRSESRKRNVCPNVNLVLDAVAELERQWRDCCSRRGSLAALMQ